MTPPVGLPSPSHLALVWQSHPRDLNSSVAFPSLGGRECMADTQATRLRGIGAHHVVPQLAPRHARNGCIARGLRLTGAQVAPAIDTDPRNRYLVTVYLYGTTYTIRSSHQKALRFEHCSTSYYRRYIVPQNYHRVQCWCRILECKALHCYTIHTY